MKKGGVKKGFVLCCAVLYCEGTVRTVNTQFLKKNFH